MIACETEHCDNLVEVGICDLCCQREYKNRLYDCALMVEQAILEEIENDKW